MINHKNCCGCTACYAICPVKAIQMVQNEEGFYVPSVDESKCIQCGKCQLVCPLNHPNLNLCRNPDCYAIYNKDEKIRRGSSSGGVFSLLAEEILKKGGYVCGATYSNDKLCHHIIIDNVNDLAKLRGSKYIQSNVGNTYEQTKKLLNDEKWVLYSGTPCQIAGLKNYLGGDYERLLTVDLVCHGTPSPKAWRKYLEENFPNEKIQSVNFRDKTVGWEIFSLKIKTNQKEYSDTLNNDLFMKGFLQNLYLNPACSICSFKNLCRPGDITLGDFWGIQNLSPEINDHKGLSLILLNSMKGHSFFYSLDIKKYFFKRMNATEATRFNPYLKYQVPAHLNSKLFFPFLKGKGFNQTTDSLLSPKKNIGILNLWFANNYGALLTGYAVQKILIDLGYIPHLIQNTYHRFYQLPKESCFRQFSDTELITTSEILNRNELKNLNQYCDSFIVAGDQVWRLFYTEFDYRSYFLDFVSGNKTKLALSVSFGKDEFDKPERKEEIKNYLKDFKAISVREKSGVKICRSTFDMKAKHLFDPVFLCNPKYWRELSQKSSYLKTGKYLFSYVLYKTENLGFQIREVANQKKLGLLDVLPNMSVYSWVRAIKDAEIIVTDSFHGVCFSIIFKKEFICLHQNKNSGKERFISLLSDLGLMDRLFYDLCEVDWDKLPPIDYQKIEKIIEQKRQEGINFLINALEE